MQGVFFILCYPYNVWLRAIRAPKWSLCLLFIVLDAFSNSLSQKVCQKSSICNGKNRTYTKHLNSSSPRYKQTNLLLQLMLWLKFFLFSWQVLGNVTEFQRAVKLVIETVSFDKDSTVQVFEANIRCKRLVFSIAVTVICMHGNMGFHSKHSLVKWYVLFIYIFLYYSGCSWKHSENIKKVERPIF